MKINSIIVEDFYIDPDAVRKFALAQNFDVLGNYPGARTATFFNDSVKEVIQRIVEPQSGRVTNWLDENYSGSFQLCYEDHRTWIHADSNNTWAGVCYLTPNAPLTSGTALYRHKESQDREKLDVEHDGNNMDDWEEVDRFGNIYNRLVLYRGNLFHASIDYFGTTPEDGRLFQTFFFNTEY